MHPLQNNRPEDEEDYAFLYDEEEDLVETAAEYAEEGDYETAYDLIRQAIKQDRHNVEAWWALAQLAHSDEERNHAVRRVLTLDPGNTEAVLMRDQIQAGTLHSLDTQQRKRKLASPAHDEAARPRGRDYLVPAAFTFLAYNAFYIVGLILNIHFLRQASQLEKMRGEPQPNKGCLQALLAVYVLLPLALVGLGIFIAVLGFL